MAYTTVIRVTHNRPGGDLGLADHSPSPQEVNTYLGAWFERQAAGFEDTLVQLGLGGTAGAAATGTVTLASGSGSITITINGVAVTRTWATSDAATAAAFVTDINAHANALVSKAVTASNVGGVITLTCKMPAVCGNWVTLAASGTGATASGARLTGGAGDDVAYLSFDGR